MLGSVHPFNEKKRLEDLVSYNILDTLSESDYDNLTTIASAICDIPIAAISFVDKDRLWLKSAKGLPIKEIPRERSFCSYAITNPNQIFIVEDATKDQRFNDTPLVINSPNIVFYAGVPLVNTNGFPLGTLCVIDQKPRVLTTTQINSLKALASQVMILIEHNKKDKLLNKTISELENRKTFQELIMNNIPAYLFTKDKNFRIVQANPKFKALYPEKMQDKIIGYTTLEKYSTEEAQGFLVHDKLAFEKGISETYETINFPNGELRTLHTTKIKFEDKEQNPFILGIANDVTERLQEEKLLNQLYQIASTEETTFPERMQMTLEAGKEYFKLNSGVIGQIKKDTYIVQHVSDNTSIQQHQILNFEDTYCLQTFGTKEVQAWHNVGSTAIANHVCYKTFQQNSYIGTTIFVNNKAYGTINFTSATVRKNLFSDREKYFINMIAQYVGSEIAKENNRLERESLIQDLQKVNSELEQFAYIATHDIKTPVSNIENYLNLLTEDEDIQDEQSKIAIGWIDKSVKQAQQTIADLVLVTKERKQTSIVVEDVSLNEMLELAKTELQAKIEQSKAVISSNFSNAQSIKYNKIKAKSLLLNLISNAIKFRSPNRTPIIELKTEQIDNYTCLSIKDNGLGINLKNDTEKVFGLFKRAHPKISGSGIGLYMIKQALEHVGGKITVESEEHKGSIFKVYFKN